MPHSSSVARRPHLTSNPHAAAFATLALVVGAMAVIYPKGALIVALPFAIAAGRATRIVAIQAPSTPTREDLRRVALARGIGVAAALVVLAFAVAGSLRISGAALALTAAMFAVISAASNNPATVAAAFDLSGSRRRTVTVSALIIAGATVGVIAIVLS